MEKADKSIAKVLYVLCASLMGFMALLIFAQVIARYIAGSPFSWSEELGRYVFVWMTFLGLAAGVKSGSHIALDILLKALKGKSQHALSLFITILIGVFGLILCYSGIQLMEVGARQTSPSLGVPMHMVYLVIPISGLLILYFVCSRIIQSFRKKEEQV